jgi:FAD/FMN-containing dehydrogenase
MKRRQFLQATLGTTLAASSTRFAIAQTTSAMPATVNAVLATGGNAALPGAALTELRDTLHGRLLLPEDDGYEEARHLVLRRFDKHPAFIVQASGAADVRYAVDFARDYRLLLAVKGGGHSESGVSTCDGGMMLDLSPMRAVRVDAGARRAWVSGATLAGLVDHEACSQGLIVPVGDRNTVGIGGLATGGGLGPISRRFGLTLDAIRSVDVVTADGKLVHASETDAPDLFWAVRGGGGNFGVVTNFEFELYPMQSRVVGGRIVFPFAQAHQVLSAYADYTAAAPDELYVDCFVNVVDSLDQSTLEMSVCYTGNEADAERVLDPMKHFGKVLRTSVATTSYLSLQGADKQPAPRSAASATSTPTDYYNQAGFVAGIEKGLIEAIASSAEPFPGRNTRMLFQPAGGAISRVASTATAYNHRAASHDMLLIASWKRDENAGKHGRYADLFWRSLKKHTRGFYTNDLAGAVTAGDVAVNFGENYARLARIKQIYDPTNLFRLNANIEPKAA